MDKPRKADNRPQPPSRLSFGAKLTVLAAVVLFAAPLLFVALFTRAVPTGASVWARVLPFACALFAGVLGTVFAALYGKRVSALLNALVRAAASAESGLYGARLDCRRRDEIGIMNRTFVRMEKELRRLRRFTDKTALAVRGTASAPFYAAFCHIRLKGFAEKTRGLIPSETAALAKGLITDITARVKDAGGSYIRIVSGEYLGIRCVFCLEEKLSEKSDINRSTRGARETMRAVLEAAAGAARDRGAFCVIHAGIARAALIGTSEYMERLIVGDDAETASRIMDTVSGSASMSGRILLTESAMEAAALPDSGFIFEDAPSADINGKTMRMFAVKHTIHGGDLTSGAETNNSTEEA